MSAADEMSTKGKGQKRLDIAMVFGLCGVMFSLLIFLFMFKQEREAAIQNFQVKIAQDVALFEQQLRQNLYALDSLQAYLQLSGQNTETDFRQAAATIASRTGAIEGVLWKTGETLHHLPVDNNDFLQTSSETQPFINSIEEMGSQSVQSLVVTQPDRSYVMAATALGDQDRIVVLIDLMKVIQQSLLESVDEGVSITLSATTDEGAKSLFSLESGDVAEDAIFDSSIDLLNNTLLTLNFAASESYLSDKMNYTSVMFLITGLLLSYLMGSYLKRIGQHLKTLREEQEVLADQMIDTSWNDPLTGLVNRIHFDEALDVECRRAVREFSPLTMILLRIDGFKPYTDHYGIDAADILLQRVSETLKSSVGRPGDMIARLDDHQFGFILPSTNELVVQLAERCTLSIRELEIPNESEVENGVVTLSIGVATLQPTRLLTADRLFEVANEQLLIAIDKGGDQYSAYAESGLEPSVTYSV